MISIAAIPPCSATPRMTSSCYTNVPNGGTKFYHDITVLLMNVVSRRKLSRGFVQRASESVALKRSPRTPPIPISSSKIFVMGIPAYNNSLPRSSQIDVINDAGLRIKPNSLGKARLKVGDTARNQD
uniref:Uncharacterized protein n=1 Tax=Romanomermis culicivorax TaxID=13658 RepID=A0A915L7N1_ROMCU